MTTRLPEWFKQKLQNPQAFQDVSKALKNLQLNTICESARCPNAIHCFSNKTATFLILGNVCTRNCTFCAVNKGIPGAVDPIEEQHLLEAVRWFKLRYVVITSVTRDDLDDGGAAHFVKIIEALHAEPRKILIEVLIPDFRGDHDALKKLVNAKPEVINHNIETVSRLYSAVRPMASYDGSLKLLKRVKDICPDRVTKSGLMVGLGETQNEIYHTMKHLREVGCDLLTIGQYLAPSDKHHPVVEFIPPEKFMKLKIIAEEMGFLAVACAPLVRSSFEAYNMYMNPKSRVKEKLNYV